MSALDQLLAVLDRDGVTEIVIATGRPIAAKQGGAYVTLSPRPVTIEQLGALVAGTPILLPEIDGSRDDQITVARRALRVQSGKRGVDYVIRIERSTVRAARTTTKPPIRGKAPTRSPRTQTKQPATRAARTTTKPRTKRTSIPLELATDDLIPVATAIEASKASPTGKVGKPATGGSLGELVAAARARGASDLHVAAGRTVAVRVAGDLVALDPGAPALSTAAAEAMLLAVLGTAHQAQLASTGYTDLAVELPDGGRVRANIARHQGGLKGTFRIARATPASLDELGLPAAVAKVIAHHQGLVVIAGPSGHGKTTTLAALVDAVNSTKPCHILTIEDPIEIVHPRKAAVVSQREMGAHTKTFATGLKASLREDPDVIVIGELRDRETVEIALTAAETGHLVLATMSTPSAAKTIDRLIDMFPAEEHTQVRASIAGALRAIVAQRLLPGAHGGVVAAVELVTGVLPLAVMIRDDKLYQLPNLLQRSKAFGMLRFDDSLLELARAGKISEATAVAAADNKKDLAALLRPGKTGTP